MATLRNTQARLLVGPTLKGFAEPRWLPGDNAIDLAYLSAIYSARSGATVRTWIALGWIVVDSHADPQPLADVAAGEAVATAVAASAPKSKVSHQEPPSGNDRRKAARLRRAEQRGES